MLASVCNADLTTKELFGERIACALARYVMNKCAINTAPFVQFAKRTSCAVFIKTLSLHALVAVDRHVVTMDVVLTRINVQSVDCLIVGIVETGRDVALPVAPCARSRLLRIGWDFYEAFGQQRIRIQESF